MFLFESYEFTIMFRLYCTVNPLENSTFDTLVKKGQENLVSFQSLFPTEKILFRNIKSLIKTVFCKKYKIFSN